ncbi:MAG: histidine phosphatase family protein [Myxococcales bacterium]|nr:histidine phosphatase family protein [Myxococcales bacterium]
MKLLLLRHGKAEKRRDWDGPDRLRPLTARGLQQAEELVSQLRKAPPTRIVTSPYLRCRQTAAPLAQSLGLVSESQSSLSKGERPDKALAQLVESDGGTLLCCGHAEQLEEIQGLAEERGIEAERLLLGSPEAPAEQTARLAVLDLGSTSFRLLVADVTRAGRLTPLAQEGRMLRLGAVIASGAKIPDEICEAVVQAARELAVAAAAAGAERILPVGTSALREAPNGAELTARIAAGVGAPVRILTGEEEARLIFSAFRKRILLPENAALGIDLGGGSLELAIGDAHAISLEATLPLGAARLHRELVSRDPMRTREVRAVVERVEEHLTALPRDWAELRPELAIAAGGTARALGQLSAGMRGMRPAASVNRLRLPLDELRALTEVLVLASHDERLQLPGIQRKRADLLPTGALVLTTLAETLELDGYTLCDWGLREGVLLEAAAGNS